MVAVDAAGVSFSYRNHPVLESVDLTAGYGEVVCIIGANGAGKTTLLRCLAGLLTAQHGHITVAGRDLGSLSRAQLATLQAFVPQSTASRLPMSVFDAVLLGRRPYLGWYPTTEDLDTTAAAIDRLGLASLSLRKLNQLSGGERQKVAIARAIAQRVNILLLDEPTTYLDLKHQLTVLDIIDSLAAEGVSVIMTMHDLNLALRAAHRIIGLSRGHVIANQSPNDITATTIEHVYAVECAITTAMNRRIVVPLRAHDPT